MFPKCRSTTPKSAFGDTLSEDSTSTFGYKSHWRLAYALEGSWSGEVIAIDMIHGRCNT
jgi:hypothetical protein